MGIRAFGRLLRETFAESKADRVPQLAASLAFYSLISIAPVLLIVIAIAGLMFGKETAQDKIVAEIEALAGGQGARVAARILEQASILKTNIIASILAVGTLLLGATRVFDQLQDVLNNIWDISTVSTRGWLIAIRKHFFSFLMVLVAGLLLLASLMISAALAVLTTYFDNLLAGFHAIWFAANYLIAFTITAALLACIYKIVPDTAIKWTDVWMGALLTSLFFLIGRVLVGLYLGLGFFNSIYGAAGSIIVVLVWAYYSAQILFWGAEFTKVYAIRHGSRST